MKEIRVSCAIIERDGAVLAAQRSSAMSFPLKWEFPGGKIDPGESAEECLRRELLEEMGLAVRIGGALSPVTHRYPSLIVTLYPFVCTIEQGDDPVLHEHAAALWLAPGDLLSLDWCAADVPVIEEYQRSRAASLQDIQDI